MECPQVIALVGLIACSGGSVHEDLVVPGDVSADVVVLDVPQIGDDLVWADNVFWVVSEAAGVLQSSNGEVVDLGYPGRGHVLWMDSGTLRIGVSGVGVFGDQGELLHAVPEARVFAGADGLWVGATKEQVFASDGRQWQVPDPRRVATDGERIVVLTCDNQDCEVWEMTDSGPVVLGIGDSGGDLAIWNNRVWWGLPGLDVEGEAGAAVSEDGDRVEGSPGDHLGRSIGGGFVGGVTNWEQVPRRLRILSVESDRAYAIDRHPGAGSVALSASESALLIASPGWGGNGGAVFVVEQ